MEEGGQVLDFTFDSKISELEWSVPSLLVDAQTANDCDSGFSKVSGLSPGRLRGSAAPRRGWGEPSHNSASVATPSGTPYQAAEKAQRVYLPATLTYLWGYSTLEPEDTSG